MAFVKQFDCRPLQVNENIYPEMERREETSSNVISKHDRYLISLEKQKRYLKGLNTKSKADEELEKREKAFSPYVNGANAIQPCVSPRKKTRRRQSSVPKARVSFTHDSEIGDQKTLATTPRPKSASHLPTHSLSLRPRKFWGQGSVQIKEAGGDTLRAARENVDHSYTDDFEEYESSDSEEGDVHIFQSDDSNDDEENIPEEVFTRKCWKDAPRITSTDIICEDILESTDSLNCDNIPVLGQTFKTNIL